MPSAGGFNGTVVLEAVAAVLKEDLDGEAGQGETAGEAVSKEKMARGAGLPEEKFYEQGDYAADLADLALLEGAPLPRSFSTGPSAPPTASSAFPIWGRLQPQYFLRF